MTSSSPSAASSFEQRQHSRAYMVTWISLSKNNQQIPRCSLPAEELMGAIRQWKGSDRMPTHCQCSNRQWGYPPFRWRFEFNCIGCAQNPLYRFMFPNLSGFESTHMTTTSFYSPTSWKVRSMCLWSDRLLHQRLASITRYGSVPA